MEKHIRRNTARNRSVVASSSGPYFCGDQLSAAGIVWAPFLERYRYQLPCLHEGLEPDDEMTYTHVSAWYKAMDVVPVYACRVKGDAGSWRKVLKMAGFGNAGLPPVIQGNIDSRVETVEFDLASQCIDLQMWKEYASSRPYVADSPQAEAAAVIVRNRQALVKDTVKQLTTTSSSYYKMRDWSSVLPSEESEMDDLFRELAELLLGTESFSDIECTQEVACLATFLDVSPLQRAMKVY